MMSNILHGSTPHDLGTLFQYSKVLLTVSDAFWTFGLGPGSIPCSYEHWSKWHAFLSGGGINVVIAMPCWLFLRSRLMGDFGIFLRIAEDVGCAALGRWVE